MTDENQPEALRGDDGKRARLAENRARLALPMDPEAEALPQNTALPEDATHEAAAAAEPEQETVTLLAESLPFLVAEFRMEDKDGGMLSFDKRGTEVPAEDADQLIEDAAANGVALTRKAN